MRGAPADINPEATCAVLEAAAQAQFCVCATANQLHIPLQARGDYDAPTKKLDAYTVSTADFDAMRPKLDKTVALVNRLVRYINGGSELRDVMTQCLICLVGLPRYIRFSVLI